MKRLLSRLLCRCARTAPTKEQADLLATIKFPCC